VCRPKHLENDLVYLAVVNRPFVIAPLNILVFRSFQITIFLKCLKVDEIRISCVNRKALIWRITIACRRYRKYLPTFLVSLFKKIHKSISLLAKLADTIIVRQRGYVH